MKKLLFTTTLGLLCTLASFSQYHYKIELNYLDSLIGSKSVFTEIRSKNILCIQLQSDEHSISFDSPHLFYREELENWLQFHAKVTGFYRGKSQITTLAPSQKSGGLNCSNATQLCDNSVQTGNSSGFGTQDLNSTNKGCLSTEHQSSWYYINVGIGGTLDMSVTTTSDYDFAIWGPFTAATAQLNCPPTSEPIRCSYSNVTRNTGLSAVNPYTNETVTDLNEDASSDGWVRTLTVGSDQVYILLLDNYRANNTPFTITWSGSAQLNCIPVTLAAEVTSFQGDVKKGYNEIVWSTLSEIENDYFSLSHSSDGVDWNVIAKVDAKGNNSSYSHKHYKYETTNYYRLNSTDLSGNIRTHSEIIHVENEKLEVDATYNLLGQPVDAYYKGTVIVRYKNGLIQKTVR